MAVFMHFKGKMTLGKITEYNNYPNGKKLAENRIP